MPQRELWRGSLILYTTDESLDSIAADLADDMFVQIDARHRAEVVMDEIDRRKGDPS